MEMREKKHSGQAMLIAVLTLGGAILGATTIAGLLMLYQIRATTDTANSAKAITAADSGVECALFNFFCADDGRCAPGGAPACSYTLGNGTGLVTTCYDGAGDVVACADASSTAAVTDGTSGSSERSFLVSLATSTSP